MKKFPVLAVIATTCFMAVLALLPGGCATIVPPSGGPRDSIPPILLEADPPDSTVNFRGNRITLSFDEYVDLKDVFNNLYFTPVFEQNPRITVRQRSIVIPFEEGQLLPNTTYILNFGNAIVDMNEGNILRDFTYTFSTGPYIDSLEISGRVLLAESGSTDSTLMAVLYRDFTDSAVINKKAPYITRVNSRGYFTFRNLPADTFAVYVIGGSGKDRRYTDTRTMFAFADQPVVAGAADSLLLFAYNIAAAPRQSQSGSRNTALDTALRYQTSVTGQQDLLKELAIRFESPLQTFDSTLMELYTDSVMNPVNFSARLDTGSKIIHLNTDWLDSTQYSLVLRPGFAIDTAGKQTYQTDTVRFMTRPSSEYGSLSIRFRNLDLDLNPVLQFVQNNEVVFSVPLTDLVYSTGLFLPGEYGLRILYDENGDGRWTPGNFFGEKRQPELVFPVERTITIRNNYANEFEIPL